MKDVKQKHQQKLIERKIQEEKIEQEQKYIASVMEEKKYDWRKKLSEQMTTSDVFFTTLDPPENTYANPIVTTSSTSISSVNAINSNTRLITLGSFDVSTIDQFEVNATLLGSGSFPYGWALQANGIVIAAGGADDPIRVANASQLALFKSGMVTLSIRQSTGSGEASDPSVLGWNINSVKFYRTVPTNVFVSLDSPEATSFIRTGSGDLSPEEKQKRLKEMLEASDEYVMKMLGLDFPGTGAVPPGEFDPFAQTPPGEAGDTPGVEVTNYDRELQKYQSDLSAYEKNVEADKQKSQQLSKAVAAARAEYLKLGQTVAQRQQSYDKLQAAIKAGTDHAISTLRNPIIKPTPPSKTNFNFTYDVVTDSGTQKVTQSYSTNLPSSVPPKPPAQLTPQQKLTPQQLADIDKQSKDLQAQSEKDKQNAQINQWKATAELGLGVAGVVGGIGVLAKIPAAVRAAQTVSQVRTATRAYNVYRAQQDINTSAFNTRITTPGTYTAKPSPTTGSPPKGSGFWKNSYEPEGQLISEKKLKSPQEVLNKLPGYYDGKPSPLGFPVEPPPKMKNGMHPDLVDGKKVADRFNRLDPESAKAMPLTGNPHIDKKVKAARKKPK